MTKTNLFLAFAAAVSCCAVILADQPNVSTMTMSCGWREFVSPHELRGIKVIRLEVDGFPTPVEGTDISEGTLAAQLRGQLEAAGLVVAAEYVPDAPRLHIRVLPVQGSSQHFFVITAEIEEPCHVPRSGGIDVPFCSTWSVYPRLGFFGPGDASTLVGQVTDVGKQFIGAWLYDNAPSKK